MSSRALAALGLLIAACGAERFAYYGMRSFLMLDLVAQKGMLPVQARAAMSIMVWIGVVGLLAGAGLAYIIGPRAAAAVGALVASVGLVALAVSESETLVHLSVGLAAFGAGMFRPCPYAAAAEIFTHEDGPQATPSPRRFAGLSAFALGAVAAINLSSMLAAPMSSALYKSAGSVVVYCLSGGVAFVAAILAATAALIRLGGNAPAALAVTDPYRGASPPAPGLAGPPSSLSLVGLAILAAAASIGWFGIAAITPPPSMARAAPWLYSMSAMALLAVGVMSSVLWAVAAASRWSVPPLLFYGISLTVFGVGVGIVGVAGEAKPVYALGALVSGAGEAALPIGIAYAALSLRGRSATLATAGWLATATVVSYLAASVGALASYGGLRTAIVLLLATAGVGAGAILAAFSRRIHRHFFEQPLAVGVTPSGGRSDSYSNATS